MALTKFNKHVLTLVFGTSFAQALLVCASPILTRIYTPDDFGVFTLFFSVIMIFSAIINLRYELAITLPEDENDAINLCALAFIINCTISLIVFLCIIIFHTPISNIFNNGKIDTWLYFIPLAVFLIGLFNILNYFNIRKENYKEISKATVLKSISTLCAQLIIGVVKVGPAGLIIGNMFGNAIANIKLFKSFMTIDIYKVVSKKNMYKLMYRYKNFPKYSVWSILSNKLAYHINDILISLFFSLASLGFYSIIQRVLALPSSLLGTSVSQVFLQKGTEEKKEKGNIKNIFSQTITKMFLFAIPFFGLSFVVVEDIFSFVFGKNWAIAGEYAKILIPFFFIRFIVVSVSTTEVIMEKQKTGLYFNLIFLTFCISVIVILQHKPFETFLTYFSIIGSIIYFLYGVVLYYISKGRI